MTQTDQSSHYLYNGNTVNILPGKNMLPKRILDTGTYEVQFNNDQGYFLNKIPDMVVPDVIYGDSSEVAKRVVKTYLDRKCNTGVLLEGEQGSGKTMLAKVVSKALADINIPTIVINKDYHGPGFNAFMASIDCPCLVFFDEFEKTYSETSAKNSILTFFDGVFDSNKLIICTVNDKGRMSSHMLNRPGRLYYSISYNRLDENTVKGYVNKNLNNKDLVTEVIKASALLGGYNFDMLQAVVEEMNRYDCNFKEAIKYLNIKPSKSKYDTGVKYLVVSAFSSPNKIYISKTLVDIPSDEYYNETMSFSVTVQETSLDVLNKVYIGELSLDDILELSKTDSKPSFTRIYVRDEHLDSFNSDTGAIKFTGGEGSHIFLPVNASDVTKVNDALSKNDSNDSLLEITHF